MPLNHRQIREIALQLIQGIACEWLYPRQRFIVADVLLDMHDLGFVHTDVKPDNIMFRYEDVMQLAVMNNSQFIRKVA